jgi:methyl-accepting chemotaxis protein
MPIRLKIFVACLLLTSVTVALGLFGLDRQRQLGDVAVRMYDQAVMSVGFVRSAETKFVQLRSLFAVAAERQHAADSAAAAAAAAAPAASTAAVTAPAAAAVASATAARPNDAISERQQLIAGARRDAEQSERQRLIATARGNAAPAAAAAAAVPTPAAAVPTPVAAAPVPAKVRVAAPAIDPKVVKAAVAAVLEDLDVATERAMSKEGRAAAAALHQKVQAFASQTDVVATIPLLDQAAAAFDDTVEQYAADGLNYRSLAEELVASNVRLTQIAIGASIVVTLLITIALSQTIVPAVRRAARVAAAIADGRLDNEIIAPRRARRSETATLLGALARMQAAIRDNLARIEGLHAERAEIEQQAAAQRAADMHKLADGFEMAVGTIVNAVSSASTELEAAASTLTHAAETTEQLSCTVAAASEQASGNVQSVASATEEMNSSVLEIARQVQESSRIAAEAVKQAEKTDARIAQLSQAASRIGDVVKLITAVAQQTNLLALNATIEAARAGESGRGFAVVAHEVKALAAETAKATDEIDSQIADMQSATRDSVAAIKEISGTIGRIAEIASTIAASVEEQGAANQEIARNVHHAARGTQQVATSIVDVSRGAGETGSASSQVLASARSLSSDSHHLKIEVDKFLATVRAA